MGSAGVAHASWIFVSGFKDCHARELAANGGLGTTQDSPIDAFEGSVIGSAEHSDTRGAFKLRGPAVDKARSGKAAATSMALDNATALR